jgi:hypothetical protein
MEGAGLLGVDLGMVWGTGVTTIACRGLQDDNATDPAAGSCSGKREPRGRPRCALLAGRFIRPP